MTCNNCNNKEAYAWRVMFDKKMGRLEECNLCGKASGSVYLPDVYWKGPGYHPGILDKDNKPIYLESRRHKAQLMQQMNLREAGDMHNGKRGTETLKAEAFHRDQDLKNRMIVREEAKRIAKILPTLDMNRIPERERDAFRKIKDRAGVYR